MLLFLAGVLSTLVSLFLFGWYLVIKEGSGYDSPCARPDGGSYRSPDKSAF